MRHVRSQRLLDLERPLFVRGNIRFHGEVYGMREELPWRDMGVSEATIAMWFRLKKISHSPGGEIGERERLTNVQGLRTDGPIIEEFVAAGYLPENYPPEGYAVRRSSGLTQFRKDGSGPWDDPEKAELYEYYLAKKGQVSESPVSETVVARDERSATDR